MAENRIVLSGFFQKTFWIIIDYVKIGEKKSNPMVRAIPLVYSLVYLCVRTMYDRDARACKLIDIFYDLCSMIKY